MMWSLIHRAMQSLARSEGEYSRVVVVKKKEGKEEKKRDQRFL